MLDGIRFSLLQARKPGDPMREHEIKCFAQVLEVPPVQISSFDLISDPLEARHVAATDVFLLGGSGDYSVAAEDHWLDRALDSLRRIHASGTPTFASCWGFQAIAAALGGRVVHDPEKAEIGTHEVFTTEEGRRDPIFSTVGERFKAQMGHEDRVAELPPKTTLLASTAMVANQAYRFDDAPIYCTQFHPEIRAEDLLVRFRRYTKYVERFAGTSFEEFARTLGETPPKTELLVRRFVEHALDLG